LQSDSEYKEHWTLCSESDHKEHEQCRVTVTISSTKHFTVTVTNMSLGTQCYQYVY